MQIWTEKLLRNMILCHMTWIKFSESLRSTRSSVTGDENRYYMSECGTEGRRVNMNIVQCRVIVDNRCEFQHSPLTVIATLMQDP